jgi:serine/threonine-protein kinase
MRKDAVLDRRYRIVEKLAAGGFGSIYRATDLVMGREVALKVLHRELANDPSVVERFRREASALAKLRDPHTITMYDVGETPDGTPYIVMELLRGESLYEQFHAHGKRLPWLRVAKIARGVCSSLREAHAVGIVHRDLKPANIHLEQHALERDYVKVLDFGIAKMVDANDPNRELTLAGQTIGTFDYMAPEQMIGGKCTGKSDVFTLGVVIYEMITGERPYGDAKGPASMLMQMLGTTPRSLGEFATVPAALDRIVQRAIHREPEVRPDVFELDEELARILDGAFGDDEAKFPEDDGPTWIEPHKPLRITPLRVSNPTRAPANTPRPQPAATLLGSATTVTPARGVPIPPRTPAPPTRPSEFAVGSRTQITPVPPTPAPVQPAPAPLKVRFATPRVSADAPPTPPTRMPSGTSPIQNDPAGQAIARSEWREDFIRGFVYALVIAAVGVGVYLML